jgi:hypothetical protein
MAMQINLPRVRLGIIFIPSKEVVILSTDLMKAVEFYQFSKTA